MCIRLLLVFSLVSTFARADQAAWATLLDPITSRDEPSDPGTLRRRPQKSVFIVPHLSLPACPTGQRLDSSGRCVQIAQVNQSLQLQFLLQKLNNLYSTAGTAEDYEYEDGEEEVENDGKPFQVALPLHSVKASHEMLSSSVAPIVVSSTTETTTPTHHSNLATIVAAPTNGKFGNIYSETSDALETELENLKDTEDSTVYNVKFDPSSNQDSADSSKFVVTTQPDKNAGIAINVTEDTTEETSTNAPKSSTISTTTERLIASHEQPFWWVPQGWEAERSRERPLLLRFWARMPLVRDPGHMSLPETVPESVIRTRTSGQRGTGRYPSEQYYREVSAHDLYNVLGAKHWRRFRATDR